jgi:hypothetical protein
VAEKGWRREFEDPIPLPGGRKLITLRDAASYIMKLPKPEHSAPEWQTAMEALILIAENGGPTMLARVGVMRALNRAMSTSSQSQGKSITGGGESPREINEDLLLHPWLA